MTTRTERVLAQRVVHDDVALGGEADDAPHREEAADVVHVDDALAPAERVEEVDVDAHEPRD